MHLMDNVWRFEHWPQELKYFLFDLFGSHIDPATDDPRLGQTLLGVVHVVCAFNLLDQQLYSVLSLLQRTALEDHDFVLVFYLVECVVCF